MNKAPHQNLDILVSNKPAALQTRSNITYVQNPHHYICSF